MFRLIIRYPEQRGSHEKKRLIVVLFRVMSFWK